MAQATWNGFLRLSLVSCPVYLSPAASDRNRLRLDPLSARTGNPVAERFVDSKTGDVVANDALVRGYRYEGSHYVTVSEAELRALEGEPSKIIDIDSFVPQDQVDRLYLETAYYLHADGPLASDTVHALRLAMARSGRVGLGRVRLEERERLVLIEPRGAGLMVVALRSADDVEPADFAERDEPEIPAEMVEIAEAIIGRRTGNFDPANFRDRYEDALRRLIDEKVRYAPRNPHPQAIEEIAKEQGEVVNRRAETTAERVPEQRAEEDEAAPAAADIFAAPEPEPQPEPERAHAAQAHETVVETAADEAPQQAAGWPEDAAAPAEPGLPEAVPREAAQPPSAVEELSPAADATPPEAEAETAPAAAAMQDETPASVVAAIASTPEPPPESSGPHDLGAEILLHIVGLGDRRYVEAGWAGNPGSHRQIEALSIRPREGLAPSAVEFKVFAREGRATSWVSDGNYAGTRGRGLPLTGFAVRPAQDLADRLEIVYEGCFFEGGVIGPKRDGELCISPIANDPLEAVRVSILERAAEPVE